jgi:hypothetical protein
MHPMFIDVKQRTQQLLKDNSATILTAGGVVGTVATAVLTGKAAFKAAEVILAEEGARLEENARRANKSIDVQVEPLTTIEKAKMVWPHFVPPVLTGSATIGSIIMANRMSAQKAAALAAAYGLAVNKTNEEILAHNYATASFYYDKLGLDPTTWSDEVGWNNHHPVEISISTVMSHDQRPCISIDFKFLPTADYVTGY